MYSTVRCRCRGPPRRGKAECYLFVNICGLFRFLAPSLEPLDLAAVVHVESPPARHPPQQFVEKFWLFGVARARRFVRPEARRERLRLDELRLADARIEHLLVVVLWQPNRLVATRLMPDELADVSDTPRLK